MKWINNTNNRINKTDMEVNFYTSWQIGLMVDFGITYERRKYISLEIPFLTIQLCGKKKSS